MNAVPLRIPDWSIDDRSHFLAFISSCLIVQENQIFIKWFLQGQNINEIFIININKERGRIK
jgi:hypothetical protein